MEKLQDGFYGIKANENSYEWIVSVKNGQFLCPFLCDGKAEVLIYSESHFNHINRVVREIPKEIFLAQMERISEVWQKFIAE